MPTPNEILYRSEPAFGSVKPSVNRLAVASLVVSQMPLVSPAAIFLGRVARRQIRESQGRERGAVLAFIGLIFGWFYALLLTSAFAVIVIPPLVGA